CEFSFDEGDANRAVYSKEGEREFVALLPDGATFEKPLKAVFGVAFKDQTKDAERVGMSKWQVSFPPDYKLEEATQAFLPMWPNAEYMVNGERLAADGLINLKDAPNHTVSISVQSKLFGHAVTENIELVGLIGKSTIGELLTLTIDKDKNAGMSESVAFGDPSAEQNAPVDMKVLEDITDIEHVAIDFTLSKDAKLFYKGAELASGARVDLSTPAILKVLAPDGEHQKTYQLSLATMQELSFTMADTEFTYGEADMLLKAESSRGLPVRYTVSDSRVALVLGNRLHLVAAGEATITAHQDGEGAVLAAEPVSVDITVKRKEISAEPDGSAVQAFDLEGQRAALHRRPIYTDLVVDADSEVLPKVVCAVRLGSDVWDPEAGTPLAVGDHELVVLGEPVVETPRYRISYMPAKLKVVNTNMVQLALTVKDGNDSPIAGATVAMGEARFVTDGSGQAIIPLEKGVKVTYTVEKEGYATHSEELDEAATAADLSRHAKLDRAYLLTYLAGLNGSLVGELEQHVARGQDGTSVKAVPNTGYVFESWSDGSTENPRTDLNVSEDKIDLGAKFIEHMLTVEYKAGLGGSIVGPASQQVSYDGESQTVEAKPAPGYEFVRWSDGGESSFRQDVELKDDAVFTAEFRFIQTEFFLPYRQNFDTQEGKPDGWVATNHEPGMRNLNWSFDDKDVYSKHAGVGAKAYFKSYGAHAYVELELRTPEFKVENVESDVKLSYNMYYTPKPVDPENPDPNPNYLRLSYSVDGGATWEQLKDYKNRVDGRGETFDGVVHESKKQEFEIPASVMATATKLQFKWEYAVKDGYYCLIDDVQVQPSEKTESATMIYLAGEGGTLTTKSGAGLSNHRYTVNDVNATADLQEVEAVADAGYHFIRWSDSLKTAKRTDDQSLTVKALFEKGEAPTGNVYTITYKAKAGGTIQGMAIQKIPEGEFSYAVAAVGEEGHKFLRWEEDGSEVNPRQDRSVADVTFTASFQKRVYTCIFELLDDAETQEEEKVVYGELLGEKIPAARPGYRFEGWFTSASFTDESKFDFANDEVTEALRLYAKWVHEWTISFKVEGMPSNPPSITLLDGEAVTLPTVSVSSPQKLSGWYYDPAYELPFSPADRVSGSFTLYAKVDQAVEVSFDMGSVSVTQNEPNDLTLANGEKVSRPEKDPQADGYAFGGWYTDNSFTTEFDFAVSQTQNVAIYAKWIELYTIKFMLGTTLHEEIKGIAKDAKVKAPATPIQEGKEFVAWYTDNTFSTEFDFSTPIRESKTLYGKWIDLWKVEFKSADEEELSNPIYVADQGQVFKPTEPVFEGKALEGWYIDKAFNTPFSFGSDRVTSDLTLYAKFSAGTTLKLVGVGMALFTEVVIPAGTKVEQSMLPEPTLEGHNLEGWYTDAKREQKYAFGKAETDPVKTLYAKLQKNVYTMTFVLNDGRADVELKCAWDNSLSQVLSDPQNATEIAKFGDDLNAPKRDGHTFDAWYTDASFETKFSTWGGNREDLTLYAKWNPNIYEVKFYGFEGATTQNVNHGEKVDEPAKPSDPGVTCKGWHVGSIDGPSYDFDTPVTAALELYAELGVAVTLVYGYDGLEERLEQAWNEELQLSPEQLAPTREGYGFKGWFLDESFTQELAAGYIVKTSTKLYAKFEKKSGNGGGEDPEDKDKDKDKDGKGGSGSIIDDDETPVSLAGQNGLRLRANPVSSLLHIEELKAVSMVRIFSPLGLQLMQLSVAPEEGIDVSRLASGIYILVVDGQTLRFAVQR
ncbi:MAG: hypothetical protein CSA97_05600, partial [Bacteroidetes bacterium]